MANERKRKTKHTELLSLSIHDRNLSIVNRCASIDFNYSSNTFNNNSICFVCLRTISPVTKMPTIFFAASAAWYTPVLLLCSSNSSFFFSRFCSLSFQVDVILLFFNVCYLTCAAVNIVFGRKGFAARTSFMLSTYLLSLFILVNKTYVLFNQEWTANNNRQCN